MTAMLQFDKLHSHVDVSRIIDNLSLTMAFLAIFKTFHLLKIKSFLYKMHGYFKE